MYCTRYRTSKEAPGYTLVEVLIVVTIIAVASAIVVPQMVSASTLGIQAAARSVIADLLYAQNEAIAQQQPRKVVIDTDAERYWLEDDEGNRIKLNWRVGSGADLIDFTRDSRFQGVRLAKVTVDEKGNPTFVDDGGAISFTFDELGGPDAGGEIGLVTDKQKYLISVAPFTGRVTVKKIE